MKATQIIGDVLEPALSSIGYSFHLEINPLTSKCYYLLQEAAVIRDELQKVASIASLNFNKSSGKHELVASDEQKTVKVNLGGFTEYSLFFIETKVAVILYKNHVYDDHKFDLKIFSEDFDLLLNRINLREINPHLTLDCEQEFGGSDIVSNGKGETYIYLSGHYCFARSKAYLVSLETFQAVEIASQGDSQQGNLNSVNHVFYDSKLFRGEVGVFGVKSNGRVVLMKFGRIVEEGIYDDLI